MADRSIHCPFLNRTDSRCAEHFHLDHLQHAFRFCFDRYEACPLYDELLAERQCRRRMAGHLSGKEPAHAEAGSLVQVTIHRGGVDAFAARGREALADGYHR